MSFYYDFHLHSCLSPCGDEEMTPYNLVQMAALLGYDIIALTDHNTVGNCRSAIEVGKTAGVTVIPGMELCTSEEIHMVCLFAELEQAEDFGRYVLSGVPQVKNKAKVFGRQLYMDAGDTVIGEEELLLLTASSISIEEAQQIVREYGGFCFPAHIDRAAYSVISTLGTVPEHLGFRCVEVTPYGDWYALQKAYPALQGAKALHSSDAHRLEDMREAVYTLELPECSALAVLDYLKNL